MLQCRYLQDASTIIFILTVDQMLFGFTGHNLTVLVKSHLSHKLCVQYQQAAAFSKKSLINLTAHYLPEQTRLAFSSCT